MWKQATNPLYVAGKRKQYTFIIPDPHPGPLQILVYEIIKHQGDVVMTLGILDTNIYNTYIVWPLFVWLFIYNNLLGGLSTFLSKRVG